MSSEDLAILVRYRSIITSFLHVWAHVAPRQNHNESRNVFLHGPRFLMAWNIHISCGTTRVYSTILTRGMATRGIVMRVTATDGNTHEHTSTINILTKM